MNAQRPWMGPPRRYDRGMTLVELLGVLSILAILMGIGIPGMHRLVAGTRAESSMTELFGLLGSARQTAILTRREVTLCGTANGTACSRNWDGMPTLVFIDSNRNRRADANDWLGAHTLERLWQPQLPALPPGRRREGIRQLYLLPRGRRRTRGAPDHPERDRPAALRSGQRRRRNRRGPERHTTQL